MPTGALRNLRAPRVIAYARLLMLGLVFSASWTGSAMSSSPPERDLKSEGPSCPDGTVCCGSSNQSLGPGNAGADLWVFGPPGTCTVQPGQTYMYRNVSIFDGGTLQFADDNNPSTKTDFWAANILVEGGGTLRAGTVDNVGNITPFGGTLTVHLYGPDQGAGGKGVACVSDQFCGAGKVWGTNKMSMEPFKAPTCKKSELPGTTGGKKVNDCFYNYDSMPFDYGKPTGKTADGKDTEQSVGYFGYKVLGIGYNGTLQLFGKKGATFDMSVDPTNTGTSWVRLNNCDANPGDSSCIGGVLQPATNNNQPAANQIVLSKKVDWQPNDNIVISSTDYLPGHAEQVQILAPSNCDAQSKLCDTFTFKQTDPRIAKDNSCPVNVSANSCRFQFSHNASQYSLDSAGPNKIKIPSDRRPTGRSAIDTRAAVGLLTRSIRIVSGGNSVTNDFPTEPSDLSQGPGYFFGGHMVIRQGFAKVQLQGVEFYQMGQGGELGHYPIHFHMTRRVPGDTFVKDCSIWDSMTRWIVLHATQGVLLARNVGYKSIGHGFYLEDGTETDNRLYTNLGVFARAAIANVQNPRQVPGILAAPDYPIIPNPPPPPPPCKGKDCPTKKAAPSDDVVPYHSDWDHPSVFWIMNGWNDFEYNMAAGAGTCGTCYWLLPAANSAASRNMSWEGYASEQQLPLSQTPGGTTPLQVFTGNTCVSAESSFLTIGNATACNGVQIGPNQLNRNFPVLNPAPALTNGDGAPSSQSGTTPDKNGLSQDNYYPQIGGGGRFPTKCPDATSGDCSTQPVCNDKDQSNCVVTIIDHYITSFNWAETNFAAIWLRPMWYLFINSAITDVQNGGITFVTGGGYTRSDVINGHWALARKSVLVGNTQTDAANPFASNAGPFNPGTKSILKTDQLRCDIRVNFENPGNYCLSKANGVSFPVSNFANNQRLFSIYDGPAYEDSNAYVDITRTNITDCSPQAPGDNSPDHNCAPSNWPQAGQILGMPFDPTTKACYLPNAAIAWKQPNGFYYPPAFHSRNLFFGNVDIRHFVIEPLFDPSKGLFITDSAKARTRYCTYNSGLFTGYTDVDRQTELNDDDGTLTGLLGPTAQTGLVGTISVNQDEFFKAPLSTPECLSDLGVTPTNAVNNPTTFAGTASTSPYDYVTTVVYPACITGESNRCGTFSSKNSSFDTWAEDCANQNCYGVPLYREYTLTGESGAVPIRMGGQAKGQRSTLTTNNNRYYIDTTPSGDVQVKQGNVNHANVFQKGGTYYVFLLFAKSTTRQTYDLYVGPGFNPKDTDQLWLTRVELPSTYEFHKLGTIPNADQNVSYNQTTGVLSVTLNMGEMNSKKNDSAPPQPFSELYDAAQKDQCQPKTFCQWVNNASDDKCQCQDPKDFFSPPSSDFLKNECSTSNGICSYATKDVDCPVGGCIGFGVKLSENFQTSDTPPSPAPSPTAFPSDSKSPWNIEFSGITDTSDQCHYPKLPQIKF